MKKFFKVFHSFYKEFASLSGFIILAGTICLSFTNFISIPPTYSLTKDFPLEIPLVIKNTTLLNIHDLKVDAQSVIVKGDTITNTNVTLGRNHIRNELVPLLRANSSHTMKFPSAMFVGEPFTKITKAIIQVDISYKVFFVPFTEEFRFVAVKQENGLYGFYPLEIIKNR